MDKPTFGSLCSGLGGLDIGLIRAGFDVKFHVEIDDYARKVLRRHFPAAERFRNVRQFPPKPDSAWLLHQWKERFRVDAICAGFPCQDISTAGRGAGLSGSRSGLFYEVVRIIRTLEPKVVLLENVSALFTRGIDQVLGALDDIGYNAQWHCLSSAAFGADHLRKRAFIAAYSKRIRQPGPWERIEPIDQKTDAYREASGLVDAFRKGSLPYVCRRHVGVPSRMEQLTGLGNAVDTVVAEYAGRQFIKCLSQ